MRSRLLTCFFTAAVAAGPSCSAALAQSGDETPLHQEVALAARGTAGSPFIPVDSWITSSAVRLYELGYLPTLYLGLRPWTRVSLAHALKLSQSTILQNESGTEAEGIFNSLAAELRIEMSEVGVVRKSRVTPEYGYTRLRAMDGDVLTDSFHIGQTIINDYGRPSESGVNNITGFAARGVTGRFSLSFRGEYQHAPSGPGLTPAVAAVLTGIDMAPPDFPSPVVAAGPVASKDVFRIVEADASAHLLGHEISFGKQDAWLGPAQGASMIWSNNAESPYTFRINRVEPLWIPGLSRITGLFRYEFRVGSLKGHTVPNDPWIHSEKVSFKPTPDLEFGFTRSVIWGGKDHVPITLGSFWRSFISLTGVSPAEKASRQDPGARFSQFDFSWRIPWQSHLVTIYTDSITHDNVFPVSNPPRAGWRPGIYLARLPWMKRADLRVEAADTDTNVRTLDKGQYTYWETAQPQGYTNKGILLGDWIGRQNKGGQAWMTWHLRPGEFVQLDWRMNKASMLFLPGGTTQQSMGLATMFRPRRDVEITGALRGEWWRAPVVSTGTHTNVYGDVQVKWYFRPQ